MLYGILGLGPEIEHGPMRVFALVTLIKSAMSFVLSTLNFSQIDWHYSWFENLASAMIPILLGFMQPYCRFGPGLAYGLAPSNRKVCEGLLTTFDILSDRETTLLETTKAKTMELLAWSISCSHSSDTVDTEAGSQQKVHALVQNQLDRTDWSV